MKNALVYIIAPGKGVCIGGRFDGWLMRKHPDGQWVSVRRLPTENPEDAIPEFLRHAPKRGLGE